MRVALLEQSENLTHSAKMLGASPSQLFRRITLPLIRPSVAVGIALVAMETLGDFGTRPILPCQHLLRQFMIRG